MLWHVRIAISAVGVGGILFDGNGKIRRQVSLSALKATQRVGKSCNSLAHHRLLMLLPLRWRSADLLHWLHCCIRHVRRPGLLWTCLRVAGVGLERTAGRTVG